VDGGTSDVVVVVVDVEAVRPNGTSTTTRAVFSVDGPQEVPTNATISAAAIAMRRA
jgi:phage gp45-like